MILQVFLNEECSVQTSPIYKAPATTSILFRAESERMVFPIEDWRQNVKFEYLFLPINIIIFIHFLKRERIYLWSYAEGYSVWKKNLSMNALAVPLA